MPAAASPQLSDSSAIRQEPDPQILSILPTKSCLSPACCRARSPACRAQLLLLRGFAAPSLAPSALGRGGCRGQGQRGEGAAWGRSSRHIAQQAGQDPGGMHPSAGARWGWGQLPTSPPPAGLWVPRAPGTAVGGLRVTTAPHLSILRGVRTAPQPPQPQTCSWGAWGPQCPAAPAAARCLPRLPWQ